ncbi:group III truncated hemoglobin [Aestuariivirga sp.]|uniref:group III truncated hemoglobin n=1 Tax=Aestuariivirga sp. TaxID=2650926 RepID=UPI003919604E
MDHAARRAAVTAEIRARTGIDDEMIRRLVHGFYDRVRADPVLGPVFAARIEDWEPHLKRMCAFWSSVALLTGTYHGRPMQAHQQLPVDARHFDRWLQIFEAAARDLTPPAAADLFIDRARRIAESLEMGIAMQQGVMLATGQRFRRDAA